MKGLRTVRGELPMPGRRGKLPMPGRRGELPMPGQRCELPTMQFEKRLQTVVGEFYSEVGYIFNFEKP